jgi:hypothetical protein
MRTTHGSPESSGLFSVLLEYNSLSGTATPRDYAGLARVLVGLGLDRVSYFQMLSGFGVLSERNFLIGQVRLTALLITKYFATNAPRAYAIATYKGAVKISLYKPSVSPLFAEK